MVAKLNFKGKLALCVILPTTIILFILLLVWFLVLKETTDRGLAFGTVIAPAVARQQPFYIPIDYSVNYSKTYAHLREGVAEGVQEFRYPFVVIDYPLVHHIPYPRIPRVILDNNATTIMKREPVENVEVIETTTENFTLKCDFLPATHFVDLPLPLMNTMISTLGRTDTFINFENGFGYLIASNQPHPSWGTARNGAYFVCSDKTGAGSWTEQTAENYFPSHTNTTVVGLDTGDGNILAVNCATTVPLNYEISRTIFDKYSGEVVASQDHLYVPGNNEFPLHQKLLLWNGVPTFAFMNDTKIQFVVAKDTTGLIVPWNTPEIVADLSATGHAPGLDGFQIDSGEPAILSQCIKVGDHLLWYSTRNASGTWHTEEIGVGEQLSNIVLGMYHGNPYVFFQTFTGPNIYFTTRDGPIGTNWNTPLIIGQSGFTDPNTFVMHDRIYIVYQNQSRMYVQYNLPDAENKFRFWRDPCLVSPHAFHVFNTRMGILSSGEILFMIRSRNEQGIGTIIPSVLRVNPNEEDEIFRDGIAGTYTVELID